MSSSSEEINPAELQHEEEQCRQEVTNKIQMAEEKQARRDVEKEKKRAEEELILRNPTLHPRYFCS
ncbi:hypothetical protein BDN67DRAFT_1017399 [Paxillus ammoniavirescens]|nr:hypothetical protein BDN67DRAFT_1017399 [Paxillus ammoniavirescens]